MSDNEQRPAWWPENPYPEEIFPMTVEEYVKAIPDGTLRTAISGCMARFGWEVADRNFWKAYQDNVEESVDP